MTPERWQQITAMLRAAVACDPATRAAFLEDACRDDPDLQAGVLDLLAADDETRSLGATPLLGLSRLGPAASGADADSTAIILEPGTRVGDRFLIVRAVGEGGMGTVYAAIDETLNRAVALKCALPGYRHRLPPEARAAREVSHFNVCKMHDLHVVSTAAGEIDLLSMEFIDGETLAQRIKRDGPLAPAQALEIARQVCAGLAQAHRQEVIHGDLKGANVILGKSAQGGLRAVITDFGLARLKLDADSGERGGTRAYMAPELVQGGRATVASDIYALGVMLHVMLVGRPPDPDDARPEAQMTIAPLPAPWNRIVARCLQADPASRPSSVDAVSRALEPNRWRWKAAAAALGVAAIVALSVWAARRQEPLGPPVRLIVLPIAARAGDSGPPPPISAGVGTGVAARLTGLRRNFTVIPPSEARLNQVDTGEKGLKVLGATHVLETHMHARGAEVDVTAVLIDGQSGRLVREMPGSYPSEDPEKLITALVGMVTEAFRLPAGNPDEILTGPAGAAYAEGMGLLREGGDNGRKALPYFTTAIKLSPWSALPYAGLAEGQLQLFEIEGGDWLDRANANVVKARSLNAASVPVLLVSGTLAQQYGRYEDAIRDFTRVVELEPTNSEAWRRLAICYERTNRGDDVVATYEKAIQAQPGYYRHYLSLGNYYLSRGQFDRAETMYRKVTEVAPDLAVGRINLGVALLQQGRFAEAEASLQAALRIRESAFLLVNLGALYYAQERYQEALGFFERCIAYGEPTMSRYYNLGDAYRHVGRPSDAATAYRKAMKLAVAEVGRDPRRASSRVVLGLTAAQLGDRHRAEDELSQSLALEPENATVTRLAAIGYEILGQREKTLAVLDHASGRLLEELARQPDVKSLQRDPRFLELRARNKTLQ